MMLAVACYEPLTDADLDCTGLQASSSKTRGTYSAALRPTLSRVALYAGMNRPSP